jgi:hypothetical protein
MQVGRWFAGMSLIRWPRSRMSPDVGVSMPALRSIVVCRSRKSDDEELAGHRDRRDRRRVASVSPKLQDCLLIHDPINMAARHC